MQCADAHTYTHRHAHRHRHRHTQTHTHTDIHTQACTHTQTCTHRHRHTHTHTQACTHTDSQTCKHTHAQACTHTDSQTCKHTHAHTQTYTHTNTHCIPFQCSLLPSIPSVCAVIRGHRLAQPPGCPDGMYTIMKRCWLDDRPTFAELSTATSRVFLLCMRPVCACHHAPTQAHAQHITSTALTSMLLCAALWCCRACLDWWRPARPPASSHIIRNAPLAVTARAGAGEMGEGGGGACACACVFVFLCVVCVRCVLACVCTFVCICVHRKCLSVHAPTLPTAV